MLAEAEICLISNRVFENAVQDQVMYAVTYDSGMINVIISVGKQDVTWNSLPQRNYRTLDRRNYFD